MARKGCRLRLKCIDTNNLRLLKMIFCISIQGTRIVMAENAVPRHP